MTADIYNSEGDDIFLVHALDMLTSEILVSDRVGILHSGCTYL